MIDTNDTLTLVHYQVQRSSFRCRIITANPPCSRLLYDFLYKFCTSLSGLSLYLSDTTIIKNML